FRRDWEWVGSRYSQPSLSEYSPGPLHGRPSAPPALGFCGSSGPGSLDEAGEAPGEARLPSLLAAISPSSEANAAVEGSGDAGEWISQGSADPSARNLGARNTASLRRAAFSLFV